MTLDLADFRVSVLLSLRRALWEVVTPTLRAVTVRISQCVVEGRLLCESVGDEERELASLVETYVLADFPPEARIGFSAVSAAPVGGIVLGPGEEWVYRRCEGDSWTLPVHGRSELTAGPVVMARLVAAGARRGRGAGGGWFVERVDVGQSIGTYVSRVDGARVSTRVGMVLHGPDGRTLVVPARPATMPESAEFRAEALLSLQRAMWDLVATTLRAVTVRIGSSSIRGRLLYEFVGDEERGIVAFVSACVAADFIAPIVVEFDAVALPPGKDRGLESGEEWFYLRCEEDVLRPPDRRQPGGYSFTPREAFLAMSDFVWEASKKAGFDMNELLLDTSTNRYGGPSNITAWESWMASVRKIQSGLAPRSE